MRRDVQVCLGRVENPKRKGGRTLFSIAFCFRTSSCRAGWRPSVAWFCLQSTDEFTPVLDIFDSSAADAFSPLQALTEWPPLHVLMLSSADTRSVIDNALFRLDAN